MGYSKRFESGTRVRNLVDSTYVMRENVDDGMILTLDRAKGITVTLPPSTGRGAKYTFVVKTAPTSNSHIIKVANSNDIMNGSTAYGVDDDGEGATGYQWMAEAADDTFTMDGTATGGLAGNMVECVDYAEGYFRVTGFLVQSGGSEATPFSATV